MLLLASAVSALLAAHPTERGPAERARRAPALPAYVGPPTHRPPPPRAAWRRRRTSTGCCARAAPPGARAAGRVPRPAQRGTGEGRSPASRTRALEAGGWSQKARTSLRPGAEAQRCGGAFPGAREAPARLAGVEPEEEVAEHVGEALLRLLPPAREEHEGQQQRAGQQRRRRHRSRPAGGAGRHHVPRPQRAHDDEQDDGAHGRKDGCMAEEASQRDWHRDGRASGGEEKGSARTRPEGASVL